MEAKEIVKVLKGDKEALKELTEELVQTPDVRLALINAMLRDVATKEDLKELRAEFKEELTATEQRIKSYVDVKFDTLNKRIDDLYKVTVSALFGILLTLATLIITRVF